MMKELTLRAFLLGLFLSVLMGAANVYLGLKIGMTVSASIPAAVIGSLVLRSAFRGGTILEANQIQTSASAGESIAAGVIFTLPALVLIGAWSHFFWWQTTLIAIAGGLLGVLMMIPMRKVFIIEDTTLAYPEGVACAAVLKSAYQQNTKANGKGVIFGTIIGATFKILDGLFGIVTNHLEAATIVFGRIWYMGSDISPALLGVGFIVRLQIALLVFAGGVLGWILCIPLLTLHTHETLSAVEHAWLIWDQQVRYIGVGAMAVGGICSVVKVREGLKSAFNHILVSVARRQDHDHLNEDISARSIIILSTLISMIMAALYYHFTQSFLATAVATALMLLLSFFFTAVASYIVGLVGSSNSPVSGMTITAVLLSGALIAFLGKITGINGLHAMSATLGIAAVVCCAACTSGDVCNDLKTGHLVGANPRLQQINQMAGIIAGALVMAPILELLHNNTEGGIGGRELAAPQATLFANLARGFFGGNQIPWHMVIIGAMGGIVIVGIDTLLEKNHARFRMHLMPIAVGIYLPFRVTVPMLIGASLAYFVEHSKINIEERLERGVLLSSGLIAGEALMGIGIATLAALEVPRLHLLSENSIWLTGTTLIAAIGIIEILRRHTRYAN